MANLKELRNRITSIGSTMKITSAMKMVSAAKLKKAQDAIVQMRPYASKLTEILQKASSTLDSSENAYGEVRDGNKVRLVVMTSFALTARSNAIPNERNVTSVENNIVNQAA